MYEGVIAQEQLNIFYPPQVHVPTPVDFWKREIFSFATSKLLKFSFAATRHRVCWGQRGRACGGHAGGRGLSKAGSFNLQAIVGGFIKKGNNLMG